MTKDDRQAFEVPDRLFEYVRAVVDNRALATVLLFLLSLLLIGIDNIAGILAVLLIGFLLIDRFETVRRCVVIGGVAWVITLAIGAMALGGIAEPVFFDVGFVFNMLGFVLALAVCVLFFCGRALYYQGYARTLRAWRLTRHIGSTRLLRSSSTLRVLISTILCSRAATST